MAMLFTTAATTPHQTVIEAGGNLLSICVSKLVTGFTTGEPMIVSAAEKLIMMGMAMVSGSLTGFSIGAAISKYRDWRESSTEGNDTNSSMSRKTFGPNQMALRPRTIRPNYKC